MARVWLAVAQPDGERQTLNRGAFCLAIESWSECATRTWVAPRRRGELGLHHRKVVLALLLESLQLLGLLRCGREHSTRSSWNWERLQVLSLAQPRGAFSFLLLPAVLLLVDCGELPEYLKVRLLELLPVWLPGVPSGVAGRRGRSVRSVALLGYLLWPRNWWLVGWPPLRLSRLLHLYACVSSGSGRSQRWATLLFGLRY